MAYRVVIQDLAMEDARQYALYIWDKERDAVPARRWLDELQHAIAELAEMPRRFRVIAEQAHFAIELRQFSHYSHRVIYHVADDTGTVHVLRVYHQARKALEASNILS